VATKKKKKDKQLSPIELGLRVQEYRQARAKLQELRTEYLDIGSEFFKEECAALFAKNPDLKSFGWKQYCPYFNDGDACTFSAHTQDPLINGFDYYNDDPEEMEEGEGIPLDVKRLEELRTQVTQFLEQYDDVDLENWFGDHVEVTVTPDSVSTCDYDHD
jgi:hypothetical protein